MLFISLQHIFQKTCCDFVQITKYNIVFSLLLLHYFIRKREKQGGEKGKSIIQTNNHANLKRYSKSLEAAEREKKATPHHLSAAYQVYTKGGDMGGAEYLGWKAYLPCL